jgi:DNA-binding transcriptional MocR family regulator
VLIQKYISGSSAVNIASSLEEAVARGNIAEATQLPAMRQLAAVLEVSPATVAAAYRILQERGVIVSDGRRGTSVRTSSPVAPPVVTMLPPHVHDLSDGSPDPRLLPHLDKAMRHVSAEPRLYDDSPNDARLLDLARAQFAADGVAAAHVAVTSGALDGIERVLREHLRPGDRVAVEDPCFTGILDLLNALALVPVPVAMDDEGILPDALRQALGRQVTTLIVTPRAQNPTGAAITSRRARQLQPIIAARPDLLIIEDDHAGPVSGVDYVTLTHSKRERWAIVRSVSKSLGPDLRVALLAGDTRTISRVEGRQSLGIRWVSNILQQLVVALWRDREVQRLVARAEREYTKRRKALLRALAGHGITAHGASGLNVWIEVPEESAVVQALMSRGWAVQAGERYRIASRPALRVTIARLDEADAPAFATELAAILAPRNGGRSRAV